MKKKLFTVLAVAFLTFSLTACLEQNKTAQAAQNKTVYAASREILFKSNAGAQAAKEIDAKFADRRKALDAMGADLVKLQNEVKPLGEKSPKFADFQAKAAQFQQERNKLIQDTAQEESRQFQPIADKITKLINDYAKEKGIQIVQERPALLFLDPSLDITGDIIKKLNESK